MSKKRNNKEVDVAKTRRQQKIEQEEAEAKKRIYTAVAGIVGLIALVVIAGIIIVGFVQPKQPIAIVAEQDITLGEWQERVQYQRANLIANIEQFYDNAGGDVGIVQQVLGQQMILLYPGEEESLGGLVLDDMIEDILIRNEAERRGINVSETDVRARLGEGYNYFPAGTPTALPTATASPQPTASLTPIPTAVITEVIPTNTPLPTVEPPATSTPGPTATLVSAEAFQEQYNETITQLNQFGASQDLFEQGIESQMYRERLTDALAEEQGYETERLEASAFILTFQSEAEANDFLAQIDDEGFLTTWNSVRSIPVGEGEEQTASAREQVWLPQSQWEAFLGTDVGNAIFDLGLNTPSEILTQTVPAATAEEEPSINYHIVQVSGREMRPLSQGLIDQAKQEVLTAWLEQQRDSRVEEYENRWRNRSPSQPSLDPKFFVAPTPAPASDPNNGDG